MAIGLTSQSVAVGFSSVGPCWTACHGTPAVVCLTIKSHHAITSWVRKEGFACLAGRPAIGPGIAGPTGWQVIADVKESQISLGCSTSHPSRRRPRARPRQASEGRPLVNMKAMKPGQFLGPVVVGHVGLDQL